MILGRTPIARYSLGSSSVIVVDSTTFGKISGVLGLAAPGCFALGGQRFFEEQQDNLVLSVQKFRIKKMFSARLLISGPQ